MFKLRAFLFTCIPIFRGVAVEIHHPVSGLVMVECPKDYGVLQNLPSMVCVRTLDPKPGETILDMCAAPGNKTTHIATLMDDQVSEISPFSICERWNGVKN